MVGLGRTGIAPVLRARTAGIGVMPLEPLLACTDAAALCACHTFGAPPILGGPDRP